MQQGVISARLHYFCPNCKPHEYIVGHPTHEPGDHPKYPWATNLACPQCRCTYTICTVCINQRLHFTNNIQTQRHHDRKHSGKNIPGSNHHRITPSGNNPIPPSSQNLPHQILGQISTPSPRLPEPSRFNFLPSSQNLVNFSTKSSTSYFHHQIKDGSGPQYLASRFIFHLDHTFTALTIDDISLNLLLGHLVLLLPDKPRKMLCKLLEMILSRTTAPPLNFSSNNQNNTPSPQYHISHLPTQFPELRRQFLKGSYAMFPCLPAPKVYTLGVHAYCLPSDCLQHHFSFGYEAAFFSSTNTPPTYSHPKHSPRGIEIASGSNGSQATAAMIWSDDCDPQNSKKNRKALWCLTITFIQDTHITADSSIPTYPLAVAPKGADHRKILQKIFNDLAQHSSKKKPILTYSGNGTTILPVTIDVVACLGDQPERRGLNCLMLGAATHHARWRYSCNVGALVKVMRSCSNCENWLLQRVITGNTNTQETYSQCTVCTNWWMDEHHPLLTYKAPKTYPSNLLLGGTPRSPNDGIKKGWLRPIQLTYPVLIKVATMAHDNVASGVWKPTTAESFLKTNCINESLTKEILEKADNCLQFKMATENNDDRANANLFLREKRLRPKAFQMAELPSLYHSSLDLDHFVDPPLHLIALGCMRTTIRCFDSWVSA